MTEQERAAALVDLRKAIIDLVNSAEIETYDVYGSAWISNAEEIADAIISLLPQTQAESNTTNKEG